MRAWRVDRRHAIAAAVGAVLVGLTAVPTVWPETVCSRTENIEVGVSTEKAGVIDELAGRYNSAHHVVDGLCAQVTTTPRSSGTMKNDIAEGKSDPEVWLPTSSMWLELLEHEGHGDLIAPDPAPRSIATSTLVIAMPEVVADALQAAGKTPRTWADVLALAQQGWAAYGKPEWGDFILGRDNAETSTSGLSATVATYIAARGEITKELLDDPAVVAFVHGIESSVSRYGDEAVDFMEKIYAADQTQDPSTYRPYVDALVVQEQMAYLYNRGAPGGDPAQVDAGRPPQHPLRVVHPQDGTIRLDHPFVVLASADAEQRAVAEDFYEFLVSGAQQHRLADLGFRPPGDGASPTEQLVQTLHLPADQQPKFVEIPNGELLAEMLNRWDNVRRKARVLLLLDVSGSMNEIVDDPNSVHDRTKLQLVVPAVQQCAVDLLDDDDEVGVWTFSSDPPYTEAVPVSRVGDVRDQLRTRIQGLTASRDTALYQALDAANEMMKQTVDPERINAIVVLSDGQNTEPYPGNAEGLLAKLDPKGTDTSVRIFTVPYGHAANADVPMLAEIARLTRAAQYDASNPLDVCQAFVQVFRNFG